jgi:hypothetical protein
MPKAKSQSSSTYHEALILVEGETELEFYSAFADRFFKGTKKTIRNLKGNFNINTKVADKIVQYHHAHPSDTFDVYVCIDQERIGVPAVNPQLIRNELNQRKDFDSTKFGKFVPVIAVLMMESLFFIDMNGLYKYLRAPKKKQNAKKFSHFRTLTHKDLSTLFAAFDKQYHKGSKCEGLIASLDLGKIAAKAEELTVFLKHIQAA